MGAVLQAVDLAQGSFTIMELGCGWGCWLNNAGMAARRNGLAVKLLGIEGDEGHIGFVKEACLVNGFSSEQVQLHRGIAAARAGFALFPKQAIPGQDWSLQSVFDVTEEQRQAAAEARTHDELPMLAFSDLAASHQRIDLLHIDVQGGEADLLSDSIYKITKNVIYILVGTHSRLIEGQIMDTILQYGWIVELDSPAVYDLDLNGADPFLRIDGVQGGGTPPSARNEISRQSAN